MGSFLINIKDKMKHISFIQQPDTMECGATCLRMIAQYYGKQYSAETMQHICRVTREGVSMLSLSDAAEELGFRLWSYPLGTSSRATSIPMHTSLESGAFCCALRREKEAQRRIALLCR